MSGFELQDLKMKSLAGLARVGPMREQGDA